MGLHVPFEYFKHNLWSKERSGVKLPIWLPTTKCQESLDLLVCRCHVGSIHISLKSSRQELQLCFRLHFNQSSVKKIMGLQSYRSPNLGNFKFPNLGVSGKIDIWVQALWPCIENTMMGKVVAFPKSGPWWVLWIRVCLGSFMHQKCFNHALTNLLFGLYRFPWTINPLVTHPHTPWKTQM
jgi:hypothetical protein